GIPYDMGSGKLWHVPVTTLYGAISGEFLCGAGTESEAVTINDPVLALKRQSCVLSLLQRFASHPVVAENRNRTTSTTTGRKESKRNGGDVHHFFGDRFLLHFNASSRAPKHSLSAIYTAVNTLYELEKEFKEGEAYCVPLHFGIASSLALCGLMGPETIRVFTVVSPGEQQAAAMSRMTMKVGLPLLMTWRAVEIAKQEQQSIRSVALSRGGGGSDDGDIIPMMPRVVDCKFVPVANVVLPHEPSKQATTVFTIDADYYRKV
ncbi:adenylate cyclase, putative, partial [Bodo saltans]